jgi:hypothetical protein
MRKLFSRLLVCLATSVAGFLAASPANADWSDGFESYANGTLLNNVGGWGGWGASAASAGTATNAFARTGSNSITVAGPSGDAVHPFLPGEYSTGVVVVEAWMLLNQNQHTANAWFIVNNQYQNNGGAGTVWATQLQFSNTTGLVSAANAPAGGSGTAPINYGVWTQIRILYDWANNTQTTFYNGTQMSTGVATNAPPLQVQNIDLFQEGTTTNVAFYDDFSVTVIPEPTSAGCLAFAICGSLLFRRRKA